MKISEILKENRVNVSFEVFPPKTDVGMEKLCGAGGVFDKKAVAYDANKNVIEVTEDTYDPDNVKYYDADGNEAELTFENGKLASVEAKPFVFTGDGKKVLVENASELPEGTKFYANLTSSLDL